MLIINGLPAKNLNAHKGRVPAAIRCAITLSIGLIISGQSVAETIVLNLEQAIERAQNTDPRISEKQYLVDVAKGLLSEAEGVESWIVDLNAFVGFAPSIKGPFFDDQGKFNQDSLDMHGVSPWYNMEFTLVKPLNTFGKVKNYAKAAKNNIKVKQGDVRLQRGRTYLDVTRAYYGFLAARDIRYLLEDIDKKLATAVDLVQEWLDEDDGKVKQADLFALQTGVGVLRRYLAEAKGFEQVAMAGLRMLTGIAPTDELKLADKRIKPVDLPEATLKELQAMAMKQRAEMAQVEAGLSARRALVAAKQSEKYPNIYAGVGGRFAYSPDRDRTDKWSLNDDFNRAAATPVLGVKWDWHAGRQKAQVSQAQAELNALLEKKSFAQQGIPFQVAEEYHLTHSHHQMVQELYNAARAGRRWMISAYADFESGLEEADKVMDALTGYVLAYSDYLRMVNEYNLHVARLQVVTGEIQ